MSSVSTRLLLGFAAGAISHLTFQGAFGALLYAADVIPALPWSLEPVPPLGVPRSASLAFWAGLWGVAYASLEPRLTPSVGRVTGGLFFGLAAMLVRWFVVLPLKGEPVAEGFDPALMLVFLGFHLAFGLGLALIYGAVAGTKRRDDPTLPLVRRA